MALDWESLLSECDRRLKSSDIRDLLAVTARPDIISFAGGLPAPDLFPVEDLRASFDAVLRSDGVGALQYGPTEGYLPLRAYLAERLARRGIMADPDEILLTTGSQQALALLSTVLLRPGAPIMVEAPSYVGALQAFAAHEPRYLPVPMDDQGLRVDQAARLLAGDRPVLLYTVSTFQNPSGVTMSLERRRALLKVCAQHGVPLVEDDPYGELRFDGAPVPPLRALPGGEETIYLGTISKILAPWLGRGAAPADPASRHRQAGGGPAYRFARAARRSALLHALRPGRAYRAHQGGLSPAPRCHAAGAGTLCP